MIVRQLESGGVDGAVAGAGGGHDVPWAPGRWGPLGHLSLLGRGLLPALLEVGAAGPVVRLRIGPGSKYVVSDGSLAREILADRTRAFGRQRVVRGFRPVTGDGLFALDGPSHREHRWILTPAFGQVPLAAVAPLICQVTADFARRWPTDAVLDLDREMLKLSADIAIRCLFRSEAPVDTVSWLAAKAPTLSKAVLLRMVAPTWCPSLPTPPGLGSRRATRGLRELVEALPARHIPAESGDDVRSRLCRLP